ncbi:Dcm Site-specific DNA methylase [uncultured Caudovirales phage]|uniref:Cytosine-specific methyltransferase n=1 Tax=uncultured Caudovirales phage TaxID=2100421 RepID=A0A6J5P9J7_9CAUD|nr:Dcm Site-specific DNA methylase [uncultured Caudovirales phage]
MLNGLDLFSGIGGLSIALKEWVRPIAYCEIDPYCQGVLLSRMYDGCLQSAPIWDDITTLNGQSFLGFVDIIFGGFPCQDISVAGNGKGLAGERSGLFFEIVRLAKEIKPKFIFLENVPAITSRGGLQVVKEITEMGYDCRWCVISAASIGALHRRERWFLLAHAKHAGTSSGENGTSPRECSSQGKESGQPAQSIGEIKRASSLPSDVADCSNTDGITSQQTNKKTIADPENGETWPRSTGQYRPFESREHWQKTVSEMGKCSDGVQFHTHRLKALGNGVVPAQVEEAFKILMGL